LNQRLSDKKFCYNTVFLNTRYVNKNYWLNVAPHPNIGGILGAGYFKKYTQYGSFWNNMLVKQVQTKFAFSLVPDEEDWSWIPSAPDVTTNTYGSQLMIGDYDPTPFHNVDNPLPLKVTTSSGSGNWTFDLSQFAFGYV